MAEVRWIKIYTDMISNKKIKRIRRLPEGNNIVLIWVFLLAQAGECNKSGALYLTDTIPFKVDDLAIEFDFEVSVINFALITLEKFSMIEIFDEIIFIKNWNEYQNIEGMDKIREQTRLRNIKYREKQKQLLLSDVSVTSHDETELDIELDKEIKRYIVPDEKLIFDHWNDKKIVVHREITEIMKSHIHARLKTRTADEIMQAIDNYQEVVTGDIYFFSYKWGLNDFMNPKNLDKFLDENEPKKNFLSVKEKPVATRPKIVYDDPTEEEEERVARAAQRQQERNLGRTGTDGSY